MGNSSANTASKPDEQTSGNASTQEGRAWNSVRVRFIFLLTLALLPWLLLTVLEALAERDRTRDSQNRLADMVASNAVGDVGRTLEAGRLALEAVPQLVADLGCEAGTAEVLARLGVYEALIIEGAEGEPICQNSTSLDSLRLIDPDTLTASDSFRLERGQIEQSGITDDVVVLQSFFRSSRRTYTLVLPQTLGLQNVLDATLGDSASVALTKPSGKGIVGSDTSPEQTMWFRDQAGDEDPTLVNHAGQTGEERRLAIQYFPHLDLYVTIGRDLRYERKLEFMNPYTTVLLPIMAWLIGFGLIWLGTQTMLLTPIAKIQQTSRQFAAGKLGARVHLSSSAAQEVQSLALTLNSMAQQLGERDNRLADNLDEKDTLMREIHHRVKNNLQIIISLLNMQERKAETEEAIAAIAETRSRINAIAIVHHGLYESQDLRDIDLEPFIARLVSALADSLGAEEAGIRIDQSVESCRLGADSAIPVALFVVEAVTNAVRHGVDRGGAVTVIIRRLSEDSLQIDVKDDGRGVGDPDAMQGIGTRLMRGFARQLSGTLTFLNDVSGPDNASGLTARLTLPLTDGTHQPFQVRRKR